VYTLACKEDITLIYVTSGQVAIVAKQYYKTKPILDKITHLMRDAHVMHKLVAFIAGPPARSLIEGQTKVTKRVLTELMGGAENFKKNATVHFPRPPKEMG
jgi:acetaldehyde dehydrogenase (acetylating)